MQKSAEEEGEGDNANDLKDVSIKTSEDEEDAALLPAKLSAADSENDVGDSGPKRFSLSSLKSEVRHLDFSFGSPTSFIYKTEDVVRSSVLKSNL